MEIKSELRLRAEKASGRHNKRVFARTGFTAWNGWYDWNAWVEQWMVKYG